MTEAVPTSEPTYNPDARGAARLAAVQALYEMDVSGAELDGVLAEFMGRRWVSPVEDEAGEERDLAEPDKTFFIELLRGINEKKPELDEMIGASLGEDWTLERLEVLLRSILRAGSYELAHRVDVPTSVVINEYMDVANAFFSGGEPKMVNGVLDKLARTLREPK